MVDNVIQKSSRRLQGYTHAIPDSKAYTPSKEQWKQAVATRLSRIHSTGIGYLHSQSRLKCTWVLMLMIWCSHRTHGMAQRGVVEQCHQLSMN
jgi:hypothetical protein